MAKNIVFCADGTCNGPNETNDLSFDDDTNVYKLFTWLAGAPAVSSRKEQEASAPGQVAKYINGVGDSGNELVRALGSAVGTGLMIRVVRGYTFISRNYQEGDSIILTGFSRGAYTARALAGLILQRGLLDPSTYDPADKMAAYRLGAGVWAAYVHSAVTEIGLLGAVERYLLDLRDFGGPPPDRMVFPVAIKAIGVWDTVSAYGISAVVDALGDEADLVHLAGATLDGRVGIGFQALSLDEQRNAFVPRLWDPAANVRQRLFAGAHADVGGGYSIEDGEARLADIPLGWMKDNLTAAGVVFQAQGCYPLSPDPLGTAHQPWRYGGWAALNPTPRRFSVSSGLEIDPAIALRMASPSVVSDPGADGLSAVEGRYQPGNLPPILVSVTAAAIPS